MTIRKPVSTIENFWTDAQRINREDMNVEQEHHNSGRASIINNHFGSGALLESPTKKIIFDSNFLTAEAASVLASGDFDGTGIRIPDENQPSDINLGNQLEVELTGSELFGRSSVKVLIVGIDFQGNIQYDRFYFHKNEIQVTAKHYSKILALFFNDFKGNNLCSRSAGDSARIVIRETSSFQLSRDTIMVAQDIEPNLFFRDFKIPVIMGPNPSVELYNTLQNGIGPDYDVDSLNISISPKRNVILDKDDVTTQIGQKFIASTNNIQKITLLLGVERDYLADVENRYDWSGNLVVTLYKLQKTVSCQSDVVPNLAIEFDPDPEPIAQLSFTQQSMKDSGIVLNDVLQPVDFIFSNTPAGISSSNSVIKPGDYYAVTIKRAGAASTGVLFTGVGNNKSENSVMTLYGNGHWVDVHEDDMWFQVWTNAAKISDGQGYDEGNGFIIPKTTIDKNTGSIIDYSFGKKEFVNTGELSVNNAIIQVSKKGSHPIDDERTGNPVYSRQQYVPEFSFVNNTDLNILKNTTEPFIIGSAWDTNPKSNPDLEKIQTYPGLVKDNTFCIINPDPDLLSLNLIGSRLVPNKNSDFEYRIFHVDHCTHLYGDINGDGIIDNDDITLASNLVGEDINSVSTQEKIINGDFTTLEFLRADVDGDGIITQDDVDDITNYVNRVSNSFSIGTSFTSITLKVQPSTGRWDDYYSCKDKIRLDDNNVIDPIDLTPEELVYYGYLPEDLKMEDNDVIWKTAPFPVSGITYKIIASQFWKDYLVLVNSDVKYVPASFTYPDKLDKANKEVNCKDLNDKIPSSNPGRNDIFVPDNLLIGNGQILNPDGTHHKIDFEICKIILELPEVPLEEVTIDVFNKFVAEKEIGAGVTVAGYQAMKFADGTYVGKDALAKNQIKFGASLQAFVPNLDGYTDEDGYGIIIDDIIGLYLDDTNGLIKLTVKDLSMDPLFRTLVSKIEVTVYLKKGGWTNKTLVVPPSAIQGLLN